MNLGTTALSAVDTNSLQKLSELPTELALQRASHLLAHLVKDPALLEAETRPHLEEARSTEGDWYVAKRYEGEDLSYSLQIFVWPPSAETKIHDHSSWGVYCCAVGSVLEERYERHAHLKELWQLLWSREDGVSSVLPHDGGIHRIGNPSDSVAISVHLYGPRIEGIDGRDYDLARDYVCDRQED